MSRTSKSPRKVAKVALWIGQRTLPDYGHRFSPKTYTQPQLLACLVLMRFFKTDYRGVAAILADTPSLRDVLQLNRAPHWTTLHKAHRRLLTFMTARRLLATSVEPVLRGRRPRQAAADSTGFESTRISPYFVRRRDRSSKQSTTAWYSRFPKLHTLTDIDTHLVLAAYPKRGPTPDVGELHRLMHGLDPPLRPRLLLADAGYDSEPNHELLWQQLDIPALIPPRHGRPSIKPAAGPHRRLMQRLFAGNPIALGYGQRWQAETAMSMLKRNLGHAIAAKTYHAQNRDMLLHCIAHNAMILRPQRAFLPSRSSAVNRFAVLLEPIAQSVQHCSLVVRNCAVRSG